MDLSNYSEEQLQAEILKRKELSLGKDWPKNPIGYWEVTTEGDCEGRTTNRIGTFHGHFADIALVCASRAYYALTIRPVLINCLPKTDKKITTVSKYSFSNYSASLETIQNWLGNDYIVKQGQYSITIERNK